MKKYIVFFRNLSVKWKFVLAYFAILTVPVILTGVYLYYSNSNSVIEQSRLVMEQNLLQTRANIIEKEKVIENLSQVLVSDSRFANFIDSKYGSTISKIVDYQFEYSPYVKTILQQNSSIYSIRIYMDNMIITEMLDSYYSIRSDDSPGIYSDMLKSEPGTTGWRGTHTAAPHLLKTNSDGGVKVFSYSKNICPRNYRARSGVLDVEIKENVLFDMLRDPIIAKLGNVFIVDLDNHIVSDNIPSLFGKDVLVSGYIGFSAGKSESSVRKIRGVQSIVITIPVSEIGCSIVGIFPVSNFNSEVKKSIVSTLLVLLVSFIFLGVIVYFTTNVLLTRLKILVKAMKQVDGGKLDISVPVKSSDEFGELALSFNHMIVRIHELVEMVYKSQILEREAELKAWESQINPHFLYNTLATISWIARKDGSDDIVKLSNTLARFYRLVLSKGSSLINVSEELEMVYAFLHIQKVRFQEMFNIVYDIGEGLSDCKVIKNLLQPLVENALHHGIEPKRMTGTIILKAYLADDKLNFRIIDDGVGMNACTLDKIMSGKVEKSSGSGYAIKNIMERLKSFYWRGQYFNIFSKPGIGTVITIILDVKGGDHDAQNADRRG